MDFIYFLAIYFVALTFLLFCYCYKTRIYFIDKLFLMIETIILRVLPDSFLTCLGSVIDHIFFQRNRCMQFIYCGLVLTGHALLLHDVLPLLLIERPDTNHHAVPLAMLLVNSVAYLYTATSDPAVMTSETVHRYESLYAYDGVLYKGRSDCSTCRILKVARSKHCSYCDHCVARFDHHCVWTNSCIGLLNLRYFIVFLVSVSLMCINGTAMTVRAAIFYARSTGLTRASYVDGSSLVMPVTLPVIVQSLFMQIPRTIFLLVMTSSFSVMVTVFTLYHCYLVATNQTTNERYRNTNLTSYQPYNRGIIRNVKEAFNLLR